MRAVRPLHLFFFVTKAHYSFWEVPKHLERRQLLNYVFTQENYCANLVFFLYTYYTHLSFSRCVLLWSAIPMSPLILCLQWPSSPVDGSITTLCNRHALQKASVYCSIDLSIHLNHPSWLSPYLFLCFNMNSLPPVGCMHVFCFFKIKILSPESDSTSTMHSEQPACCLND